ncbi:MAG: DUF4230 domain-containing protein [Verrucomicrobiota bacterium]|nr:DUF4230 domain-containing protein [Verrucomicrobiota bacterium]
METPPSQRPSRRFSWALAFTLVAFAALALVAFIFFRLETWPMRTGRESTAELERLATKVRAAFVEIAQLQPQVRINNRVYLEQTTPVAELAVLTRQVEVEHEFTHTWVGSTKRVKLHGRFLVKAGFDLHEHVKADVTDTGISVELPHAQILGVEQQQVEVQEFENGYWNRISAADVENELATMPKLAREKAQASKLPAEAEEALRKQLTDRIGGNRPLQLLFDGDSAPVIPKP